MARNEAAYEVEKARGETLFNEAAFDRGRSLYDGELMGHPFRAGVKTFQVAVWRDLGERWRALPQSVRDELSADLLPWSEVFDR